MKTTGYQVAILDRLEAGAVVEVRSPIEAGRATRFWIGADVVDTRTIRRLFERGWITPTRKPGGKLTGRAVISKLGRAALRRSR